MLATVDRACHSPAHCVLEASMVWGQNMVVASIMALQPLSDFESQLRHLLGNVNLSELSSSE